ncbi:protein PHYTOCHROME KINASE SUBSTRATE 1 [Cicer arietinum]|uniref:Protein PHYTOCHROME KINASE SUBSTRATE 1 n=1 Tax=Cicer arietinum TaxID=3827 RepID=A0A1S2XLF2_CICAR|nr:protein PHYTOCHROME KINASE SUBSTRATE 1 [Cicer arietinum]
MVISATTSNRSFHHQLQTFTSKNNNNTLHHEGSFSSYLKKNEETFAKASQPFNSNRKEPLHLGVKKEEDGEIGVFDAEKYFNGTEIDTPRVANKYNYMKDQQNRNYKVQYGTPSVGSESSLNSQSALIETSLKNSSNNIKKNQVHPRKSLLASLGCKCSCYDKNSVDVNDHAGEISFNKANTTFGAKTTSEKLYKHDYQDYNHSSKNEITNHHAKELLMNKDIYLQKQEKLQQVENPRKTLEVFGSPILDERIVKSMSFDKRLLTISSRETPQKHEEEEEEEKDFYEDAESDASSDLFEIESFTGKNSFFTRTASNAASGCASPTTCYAPSEVSIEWSVVTASAVEYSAVSDHEDQDSAVTIRSPIRTALNSTNGKHRINKEMQRRRPSKLLGCNSQKSVGVAADALTMNEKSNVKVTKFKDESKVESFVGYAKPPPRRSQSPHAAQVLYV